MASELLPTLEASGEWKLRAPFDAKYVLGLAYTCNKLEKLSTAVALGVDIFAQIYEPNGLSRAVYEEHVSADITIVTLLSSEGNWLHVPSPYLDGWPSTDAVPYVVLGMLVNLGALPNTVDPTFLSTPVINLVKQLIGNTPTVQYAALSAVSNKPFDTHEALERTRKAAITDDNSDYVRRVKAEEELVAAKAHIKSLQDFIIASGTLPPKP